MTTPDDVPDLTLDEYAPGSAVALTDAERWPTLDGAGRAALDAVRHHPAAPDWVHVTGDRLRPDDLPALDDVAVRLAAGLPGGTPGPGPVAPAPPDVTGTPPEAPPAWVRALVDRAHAVVPRYRRARDRGESGAGSAPTALRPVTRDDLRRDLASLVPVDVPLGRVLEGTSSGSTGAAVRVPLHPVAVAADLVLLQHLVASAGAAWEPVPGRLGLVNLVDQRNAFTYASAMTGFRRTPGVPAPGMARVNLDPGAWRRPGDREAFLAAHDPQVVSSSPLPLLALARLAEERALALHPVALVSGAAHLSDVARARLRATWDVPVVDLYGLRETGAVAARTDAGPFVVVAGRRVWVEVLDDDGDVLPDGELGEVVVTVDENPYLPLLRYRTGDRARIVRHGARVELHDLEGRSPVRYLRPDGAWVPSVDAAQHLQAHGMAAWQLHQAVDGSVLLDVVPDRPGDAGSRAARAAGDAVGHLLGRRVAVREVSPARLGAGRARRWSSDVPDGAA